ncbi:MAG: hypothetical protein A3H49_11755 [Nitrospirae bacterium RIFCSPLOWO2_02_FULL_62_14]|nr:MAG: hypothetical protein A3H49_11755 [Nitrospirae bacterium RIFCSPLOWO2_02_FULL_62_14]OGW69954.1 MAG: hypothetical protein A3A88_10920 [Nitrospirae bacterium RIFCSPLOWO2_01_FULL_62_17]
MYPVKLGYDEAVRRIRALIHNGHHAEALVTSVFTIEKTLRRVLRALVILAGFPSTQATVLMGKFDGMDKVKQIWECFDPQLEKLSNFVAPATLQAIAETQTMRNKLVHGSQVFALGKCKDEAERALRALDDLRQTMEDRYGYDGWTKIKARKTSALHLDPRVKVARNLTPASTRARARAARAR